MFPKRSNIRYSHVVDLYTKTTEESDVGQSYPSWTLFQAGIPVSYTPSFSTTSVRVVPTVEEADYLTLFLPHDAQVDYGYRFKNLRTKNNEVIEAGYMQIIEIKKHISYSGKVQYLQIHAKLVIES